MFRYDAVQCVVFALWLLNNYTLGSVVLWYVWAAATATAVALAVTTYDYDYWRCRGVFSPPAFPIVGHIKSVVTFKEQGGLCFKRIYDTYKHLRFLGTHQFFQRTLVVRDPALIRRICVNDFHHFVDRGFFFNPDVDPLAGSVLFLRGSEWKKLRAKITPIFSPIKLRNMLPIIENTADEFAKKITKMVSKHPAETNNNYIENNKNDHYTKENYDHSIQEDNNKRKTSEDRKKDGERDSESKTKEVSDSIEVVSEKLVGGYTADAIVPCAFGLKSNVMENEDDPFAVALHAFYEMSWYNLLEKTMRQFWPSFVLFFRMRIIPKKTHDFFYNIVTSVLRARESGTQEKRGDFIDMMLALRNEGRSSNAEDDVEITDIVISANAFIIFLGGFETTSSTLAFLLLELAHDQCTQDKLRREIHSVLQKHAGKITYDMLQELHYMEMVIQEVLRLYPPFPSIQRICTKDYPIPDSDVVIEKGTIALFPTLGIQRDEQYFEDAESFKPERWEGPPPPPGVYMPFGDGPRYCIGKRFAMMQMKCCLVRVLPLARAAPAPQATPRNGPFPADPRSPLSLHPLDSRITLTKL